MVMINGNFGKQGGALFGYQHYKGGVLLAKVVGGDVTVHPVMLGLILHNKELSCIPHNFPVPR